MLLRLLQQLENKQIPPPKEMPEIELTSYLRSHRMHAGLTQQELAEIVGFIANHQISKHERSRSIPTLLVSLSYSAIFCVPVEQLFPGMNETIQFNIDDRLARMENSLKGSSPKGRTKKAIARKLQWLSGRKSKSRQATI
jgi:DNA-binding XRE family transcriptional regulator